MATCEDMMADLGLGRAEEVASDGRDRRYIPQNATTNTPLNALHRPDQGTNMWQNAIRQGLFEDSDFNSVKLLDPLSNGNLHRQNRQANRQIHDVIGALLEGDHHYDPTQPGYRGGQRKRPEIALPADHQISKHGILLPPGMVTKRWEPGATAQKPAAHQAVLPPEMVSNKPNRGITPSAQPLTPSQPQSPRARFISKPRPNEENIALKEIATLKHSHAEIRTVSVPRQLVPFQNTASCKATKAQLILVPATQQHPSSRTQSSLLCKPLVSMPNRPVPDAPRLLEMSSPLASLPRTPTNERSGQPAGLKDPEEILLTCIASDQIVVDGTTKGSSIAVFVLRQGSNLPLVRCQSEADQGILFEECLSRFRDPIQYNSTVFLRWGSTPKEFNSKQLMFTNTPAAKAFTKQFRRIAKSFQWVATEIDNDSTNPATTTTQTAGLNSKVHVQNSPISVDVVCSQIIADKEQQKALLDVRMIEAVTTDHNLHLPEAQACVRLVSGFEAFEITEMAGKAQELEKILINYYGPVTEDIPVVKAAALQISLAVLLRIQLFNGLPHEEKKRALALIYKGVLVRHRCMLRGGNGELEGAK